MRNFCMDMSLRVSRLNINEETSGTLIAKGLKLVKSLVNNNSEGKSVQYIKVNLDHALEIKLMQILRKTKNKGIENV